VAVHARAIAHAVPVTDTWLEAPASVTHPITDARVVRGADLGLGADAAVDVTHESAGTLFVGSAGVHTLLII